MFTNIAHLYSRTSSNFHYKIRIIKQNYYTLFPAVNPLGKRLSDAFTHYISALITASLC